MTRDLKYKRVLVKISGEALMGAQAFGIDPEMIQRVCDDIRHASDMGVEISIVVGGGNIFRGASMAGESADRVSADHMGMLATVMNAIALRSGFDRQGTASVVLSGVEMPRICETFSQRIARQYRDEGKIIIFAGGTGNPFFTTDTAAALRASEMQCDALLKATQVDGIYSADPKTDPEAVRFETVTHQMVLEKGLQVMDAAAVSLTQNAKIPIVVFSIEQAGGLAKILKGEGLSTTVIPE